MLKDKTFTIEKQISQTCDYHLDKTMNETNFIIRGSKYLHEDELEAHLASLIRLENVGVFLGAGASRCAGGQTMEEVWKAFCKEFPLNHQWLVRQNFVNSEDANINIEKLLDDIEIAEREWKRQNLEEKLDVLSIQKACIYRSIIKAAILEPQWWQEPHLVTLENEKLKSHRMLLQALCGSRQVGQPSPWIFTTNYDLAVEWSAETLGLKVINGFDGLHNRLFSPHVFDLGYSNLSAKGEARFGTYGIFLAKLHGSLAWKMVDDEYTEYPASTLWREIKPFLDNNEKIELPIVFPSAAKYFQTVGFVVGELLRKFTEFLSRSQTTLIISGYSFSDAHLNLIIRRALLNPTLQIVVFLPEVDFNNLEKINSNTIKSLIKISSPQVTIVGGGEHAYFKKLVEYLPPPVIYDEHALKIKKLIKEDREMFHAKDVNI